MSMRRKKLRAARIAKRWTQNQLAKKLKVSRTTVNYWETGVKTPSLYNQDVIATAFGITDNEMLEHLLLLEAEGETSEHQNLSAQSSQKEEKDLGSPPSREEARERVIRALDTPPEENTGSDEVQADAPTTAHVPITSSMWFPKAPTLHDFIASNMTRCFWQIAHTEYSTSDEMINAVRSATEDFDMMNMGNPSYKITRRDAMCELASVPMIALGSQQTLHTKRYEEMLRYCTAALEACWQLYKGGDPIRTEHAFDCVCTYVPILETIAKDSAQYRDDALNLATQYSLLQTLLGWGCVGAKESVTFAQQALFLGKESGNILLQLSAYSKLSWTYIQSKDFAEAQKTMREGEHILKSYQRSKKGPVLPTGIIGNFYSSYAMAQVDNGISPDTALGIAIDSEPLKEQVALIKFTTIDLWWEASRICCMKGDPEQAMKWIGKLIDPETLTPRPGDLQQSRRGHVQTINTLTHSLLQSKERDMERIANTWTVAIEEAKALKSEQNYRDAITNIEIMRFLWPREDRIMKLVPLTAHW